MGKTIRICSIAPEEFKIKRSYNFNALIIPACDGDKFTSLDVTDHTDYRIIHTEYDAAKAERIPENIPAQTIVTDFFSTENLENMGCFVPKAQEPTEKELETARRKRVSYLQKCIQDGDIEYARSQRVDEIPGVWKRYCEELGVERDWAFLAPKPTFDCPVCGEDLKMGVAVCRSCGAVLDKKKAAQYGLVPEDKKPEVARVI